MTVDRVCADNYFIAENKSNNQLSNNLLYYLAPKQHLKTKLIITTNKGILVLVCMSATSKGFGF